MSKRRRNSNRHQRVVSFFLLFALLAPLFLATSLMASEVSTPGDEEKRWQPVIATEQDSYFVFDMERGGVLFEKKSTVVSQSPMALNVMLALLALENLDFSRPITISEDVAALSSSENILAVQLTAGLKYSPEFLLYSVMLYDSRAAAKALAEGLADREETLVAQMNQRARSIGMDRTEFSVTSGGSTMRANSTLQDLGLLMMQALSNSSFKQIFQTKSVIVTENMPKPAFLENRMKNAWTYSNDLFTGSALAKDTYVYTTSYLAEGADYSICILQGSTYTPGASDYELINPALREAVSVAEIVFASFERTLLVSRGERYGTIVQQDGITVDLVYLDNVYVLRPTGDVDFEPELLPSVSSNIPLPVEQGEVLGQITFVMPDGSRYIAAVGSEQDIFSQNSLLERMLIATRDYSDILILVLILAAILLIVVVVKVLAWAIRTVILHQQSRRTHGRGRH